MKNEKNDWIIASTTNRNPEALSEIAIMSDQEVFTLDEIFGRDFIVEFSSNPFKKSHFDHALQKLIIKNLDDILVLFHEVGHGIKDNDDPIIKKMDRKLEGDIRNTGKTDFHMDELKELLSIRAERMASAYALKKIREVKRDKNIDLLAGQTNDAIFARIHLGVKSAFDNIKDMKEYKEKFRALQRLLKKRKNK